MFGTTGTWSSPWPWKTAGRRIQMTDVKNSEFQNCVRHMHDGGRASRGVTERVWSVPDYKECFFVSCQILLVRVLRGAIDLCDLLDPAGADLLQCCLNSSCETALVWMGPFRFGRQVQVPRLVSRVIRIPMWPPSLSWRLLRITFLSFFSSRACFFHDRAPPGKR